MDAGQIVEQGPGSALFTEPRHPYTRGLLASIPGVAAGNRLPAIPGTVPRLGDLLLGCPFLPRCPARFEPCDAAVPALSAVGLNRTVRCYLHSPAAEPPDVTVSATDPR